MTDLDLERYYSRLNRAERAGREADQVFAVVCRKLLLEPERARVAPLASVSVELAIRKRERRVAENVAANVRDRAP